MKVHNSVFEAILNNENIVKFRRDSRVPFSISMPFGVMLNKLRPWIEAYSDEKMKIIDKYCDKDKNGEKIVKDGRVTFSTQAQQEGFQKGLNDILNTEVDIGAVMHEKLCIDVSKLSEGLSVDDQIALSDLVDFFDGSDNGKTKIKIKKVDA